MLGYMAENVLSGDCDVVAPDELDELVDQGWQVIDVRTDKEHAAALAHDAVEEIASGFQLGERLAQVNDMNPVARVEDERFHLGIPTPCLVSEVDAGIQQFLEADTDHNFPFVRSPGRMAETDHPAEHGIAFSVVMAVRPHTGTVLRPLPLGRISPERNDKLPHPARNANGIFQSEP